MSIYTSAPVEKDTIYVGGAELNKSLDWVPAHVQVDNWTTQYVYLPGPGVTVGPGVVSRIVPLPASTYAQAKFQAPPNVSSPLPVNGQKCDLIWLSAGVDVVPHPGVLLPPGNQQTYQQAKRLTPDPNTGNILVTLPAGQVATGIVAIEPGMEVLTTFLWGPGPGQGSAIFRLIGHQTGYPYARFQYVYGAGTQIPVRQMVDYAVDQSYDVTIDNSAGTAAVNYVILGGPNPVTEVVAQIVDTRGNSLLQGDANGNLGVTHVSAKPAPWQAPDSSAIFNASYPPGTNNIIIPAQGAGQRIYLHWVAVYVDGATTLVDLRLRDGVNDIAVVYGSNVRGLVLSKDFKGKPLTANTPLNLYLAGASAATYIGTSADYAVGA